MDCIVHGVAKSWTQLSNFHLALGSTLELLLCPATELVFTGCRIKSAFHHMSQSNQEMVHYCCLELEKTTLENHDFFFIFGQLMRHPLIELFHLSNLLQMLYDHRMVDIEFFGNVPCSCKRISFDDGCQLVKSTSNGWLLRSSSSRPLFSLQNFLEHHCTVC